MIEKALFLLVSVALVGSASAAWKKVDDYENPATLDNWSVTTTGLNVDPNIVPGAVEYVDDPVASGQGKVLSIVNPIGTSTGSNSSMTFPLGDAAILITLEPGAYTAQASCNGAAVGEVLTEVYAVVEH